MPTHEKQPSRKAISAWILYDVGNTMFLTGVVGLFFPLWVTKEMSGTDASVGYTLSAAMASVLLISPVIGALSDQARRRMPFLAAGTLVCVVATFLLGGSNLLLALGLFGLAVVSFNVANMFYNGMLSEVSTEANRGTIGGMGAGIGYIGSIIAVGIGLLFVESRGHVFGFRTIAFLFLLSSLPLFFLLKERRSSEYSQGLSQQMSQTLVQLRETLGNIGRFPGLARFLVARFWFTWAINTASTFAVLYASETIGFDDRKIQLVLLVGILVAVPCGLAIGRIVDKVGPRAVLSVVLAGWVINLAVAVSIPWLGLPTNLWWAIGVFSGVLVAGTWACDRPFMLRLTPQRYLGEFFGLHNLTGRLSAIAGYFTWGFISTTLEFGQPAALVSLAVCAAISLLLIRGVNDTNRANEAGVMDEEGSRDGK
jgi:UMF1 family MFS transporter